MARPFWLDLDESLLRKILLKYWDSGPFLQDGLSEGALFPLEIPFRSARGTDWRKDLLALQQRAAALKALSTQSPLEIVWQSVATPVGRQWEPERIWLPERLTCLRWLGKEKDYHLLMARAVKIRERFPVLQDWLLSYPLKLQEYPDVIWEQLLQVCERFQARPRPGVYLRELDLPGIDTKFVETHQGLLKQWLDRILPPEAVMESAVLSQSQGFARRYGLRLEEPLIRCRALDPTVRLHPALEDVSLPLHAFAALTPACQQVWICENLRSFLSFPALPHAWAIFGSGRAVELLRHIPWLQQQTLFYWGDLDSHGFSILAGLRRRFPQLRSLLMDLPTLQAHRTGWVSEPSPTPVDLTWLTPEEQMACRALQTECPGQALRLEQEKIGQARLNQAIAALLAEPPCSATIKNTAQRIKSR